MRKCTLLILAILTVSLNFSTVSAEIAPSPLREAATQGAGGATVPYCDGDECGFQQGIDKVGEVVGTRSDVGFAVLIQQIVGYLLTFISLIAVLYIIFAGFQILTGNGEEEKLKKSKQTILYVILGIIVIWLAWPITIFVIRLLG